METLCHGGDNTALFVSGRQVKSNFRSLLLFKKSPTELPAGFPIIKLLGKNGEGL